MKKSGAGQGSQTDSGSRQWRKVMSLFRAEYGERTYQRCLSHSHVLSITNTSAEIGVKDKTVCQYIKDTYAERLLKIWQGENKSIKDLQFVPMSSARGSANSAADNERHAGAIATDTKGLNPNMTFANFVTGSSNELAYKAAKSVADGSGDYSPLFIHGGFGLGKTHLLHSIAHACKCKYFLLSADRFVKIYVNAVRERENRDFDDLFDGIDLLLIDDVHMIAGKQKSETELSNIVSRLSDRGCRIVITATEHLTKIESLNPGLSSRLGGGLTAELQFMDAGMARNFTAQKMKAWGLTMPEEVMDYISSHLPPDKRALESCLKAVKARAQLLDSPISRTIIEPIMKDFVAVRKFGNPTIKSIQEAVCKEFEITMNEMKSPCRHKRIVVPRQVAMYICKQLTTRSLPEIGAKFGGKDHTTVIHACKKITAEIAKDPHTHEVVQLLMARLKR